MRHSLVWSCVFGSLLMVGLTEGRAPAPAKAGPALDKATLAEVRKLQEKRRDLLRKAIEARMKLYQLARAKLDGVAEMSGRLLAAELDLAATAAERIAAHEAHLKTAQALVEVAKGSRDAGIGTAADVLDA